MYTDAPVGEIIARKRCQAMVDFAVRIGPISYAGAREAWRLRAEACRRSFLSEPFVGPASLRPWAEGLGAPTPFQPEPMPSRALIEAERQLQAALLADDAARDRWIRSQILLHLEQSGLDDDRWAEAYVDETILQPVLRRLSPSARALLAADDDYGLCDLAFEFERSFRPTIAGVRVRLVGNGDRYQAVIEFDIEVERLTEEVVRRRLERHAERDARLAGLSGWSLESISRVAGRMPSPASLDVQRSLLAGVLADPAVLAQWMARVAMFEFTFGPSVSRGSYDHEIGNERAMLASVLRVIPPRSAALLEEALRRENEHEGEVLTDFYDSIETRLLDVRVMSGIDR